MSETVEVKISNLSPQLSELNIITWYQRWAKQTKLKESVHDSYTVTNEAGVTW